VQAYQILDEVLMAGELQEVRTRTHAHTTRTAHDTRAMYLSLRGVVWRQTSLNKITHIVHEQDLLENPQMNNSEFSIF
jgi:hypothetical protein